MFRNASFNTHMGFLSLAAASAMEEAMCFARVLKLPQSMYMVEACVG